MVASLEPDDQALRLLERVLAEADEATDDMAVCLVRPLSGANVRPLSGAGVCPPRVEVLEADADDVESGFVKRFLDACGVPAAELAVTIAQARAATSVHGCALVEVTVSHGGARTRVTDAPKPATPAARPIAPV